MRKHLKYANVVSTLAVVFAMSGGALATGHYLIGSTKQISPKVLRQLQGKAGAQGKEGPAGKEGPPGKEGKAGTNGTNGEPGKEGKEGPSGVLATGYAAYRYDTDSGFVPLSLPSDDSMGLVMTLNTGGRHTGPITISVPARLVVTATLYLNNDDSSQRSFSCQVQLQPSGGAVDNIGFVTYDSIASLDSKTWNYSTGVDITPGTYNVGVLCSTGLANAGGRVFDGDLTAVASRI